MTVERKSLPVINVESLFEENPDSWGDVDRAIGDACEASGGFAVSGTPQPLRPVPAGIERLLSVFDLPQPVLDEIGKKEMRVDSKRSFRGYVMRRLGGFAYNEIFDIGPESPVSGPLIENIELLLETNAWPAQEPSPGWQNQMNGWFHRMEDFAVLLIRSMARYLQVDEVAAATRYQNSNSTFRLLRYPECPPGIEINKERDAMRTYCGREYPLIGSEHTDNGGISLLWQDQPGLQFRSPSGEWFDAHNTRDCFSVLLGEALQMQSSGRFVATPHRILGYGQIRQSAVFFLEPNLFSSVRAFSSDANDIKPLDSDTYAASMLETLRKTGRA